MKLTYAKVLDVINPSLQNVSQLKYPKETPVKHHLTIAKNLKKIDDVSKAFNDARTKILEDLCEVDENGALVYAPNEDGTSSYKLSDESKIVFAKKYDELVNTEVEIELEKLKEEDFANVDGLMPLALKGLIDIIE